MSAASRLSKKSWSATMLEIILLSALLSPIVTTGLYTLTTYNPPRHRATR